MLERPDKATILNEVARFLEEQVKPALQDPGLSYRALVAGSLLRSVALQRDGDDRERLARLGVSSVEELRDKIRARALPDTALARKLILEGLREELEVTNPRF